jgi:predicted ATPase
VLREVVERSRDPVLILLEDLQWADAESLALLAQVSADLASVPLLVVASYRDDEAPRLPADLPATQALRLERFDRRGVARLCASMLGPRAADDRLVDLVARETEGDAYFRQAKQRSRGRPRCSSRRHIQHRTNAARPPPSIGCSMGARFG